MYRKLPKICCASVTAVKVGDEWITIIPKSFERTFLDDVDGYSIRVGAHEQSEWFPAKCLWGVRYA